MNTKNAFNTRFSDRHGVLEKLRKGAFENLSAHQLCLRAHELSLISGFKISSRKDFKSEKLINCEPFDHQVQCAIHFFNRLQPRALLADEVGLGKTIEAGLIMKELIARKVVEDVLILCPKSLIPQWQEEMLDKFCEHFITYQDKGFSWHPANHRIICSVHTARNRREEVFKRTWDLVIIDEAHKMRNLKGKGVNPSDLAKFGEEIGKHAKYLLLLTATPLQNRLWDLYSITHIIRSGLLGTESEFIENHIADKPNVARKVKNVGVLRGKMSQCTVRTRRKDTSLLFSKRSVNTVTLACSPEEMRLYEAVTEYMLYEYNTFDEENEPALAALLQRFASFAASRNAPTVVILATIAEQFKRTLMEKKDGDLVLDTAIDRFVEFFMKDKHFYDPQEGPAVLIDPFMKWLRKGRQGIIFSLISIQQACMSSPAALVATLKNKTKKTTSQRQKMLLTQLITLAEEIKIPKKIECLRQVLKEIGDEKLIVFVCRLATVEFVANVLSGEGYSVQTYTGGMGKNQRKTVLRNFESSTQILLGTDALAEGLNLQFAGLMVNWDLPWNPMIVEQRIGRIDRLTQQRETIGVNNIYVKDTIEERIIGRLYQKLDLFRVAVGDMDMVLGEELQEEGAFKTALFKQIYEAAKRKDPELEKSAIDKSLRRAKQKAEKSKVFSERVLEQINPEIESGQE